MSKSAIYFFCNFSPFLPFLILSLILPFQFSRLLRRHSSFYRDTDFFYLGSGHVYTVGVAENARVCEKMCHEHEECQAFVYVKEAFGAAEAKGCHFKWGDGVKLDGTDNPKIDSGWRYCKQP